MIPAQNVPNRKPLLFMGVLFLILAVVGLIVSFATPWIEYEREGDSETYYYGDFGENFEEDWGSDRDEYYHGTVNMVLIGYLLIIILSIFFIYDGITGRLTGFISIRIFKRAPEAEPRYSMSLFTIFIVLLLIIPMFLVMIGGARFIGYTSNLQASSDSIKGTNVEDFDFAIGTTAGYFTLILGLILFFYCIFLVFRRFKNLETFNISKTSKLFYIKTIKKIGIFLMVLTVIGVISIPLFSFMDEEFKTSYGDEYNYESTGYHNDGMIHVWAQKGSGDKIDDIVEDIDRDIAMVAWALTIVLVLSILILFGLCFYCVGMFPRGSHLLIAFGCLLFIFIIMIFVGYGLMGTDVAELDDEYEKLFEQQYEDAPDDFIFEKNALMGDNYLPLILAIFILVFGVLYTVAVWPVSIAALRGRMPLETPEGGAAAAPTRLFATPRARNIVIGVIIAIVLIASGAGAFIIMGAEEPDGGGDDVPPSDYHDYPSISADFNSNGYSPENSDQPVEFYLNSSQYVSRVYLILNWQDESDETFRHENEPDNFMVELYSPDGRVYSTQVVANDMSSKLGQVQLDTGEIDPPVGWEYPEDEFENYWVIMVCCEDCGDHEAQNFGLLKFNDNGNSWSLSVEVDYYGMDEEPLE
ncbi:MAG: hypothetical protein KAJ51_11285 [Thermoplasmata archaeon]|nr:hypothetical protein [Thermoplasmata archaeon]